MRWPGYLFGTVETSDCTIRSNRIPLSRWTFLPELVMIDPGTSLEASVDRWRPSKPSTPRLLALIFPVASTDPAGSVGTPEALLSVDGSPTTGTLVVRIGEPAAAADPVPATGFRPGLD